MAHDLPHPLSAGYCCWPLTAPAPVYVPVPPLALHGGRRLAAGPPTPLPACLPAYGVESLKVGQAVPCWLALRPLLRAVHHSFPEMQRVSDPRPIRSTPAARPPHHHIHPCFRAEHAHTRHSCQLVAWAGRGQARGWISRRRLAGRRDSRRSSLARRLLLGARSALLDFHRVCRFGRDSSNKSSSRFRSPREIRTRVCVLG